jgi:hypothetical protein
LSSLKILLKRSPKKDASILRIVIYNRVPHTHKPTFATQLISFRMRHLYGDGTSLAGSMKAAILIRRYTLRRSEGQEWRRGWCGRLWEQDGHGRAPGGKRTERHRWERGEVL